MVVVYSHDRRGPLHQHSVHVCKGHFFSIYTQDPQGRLVVLMEEVEAGFEPGPATSQGYCRKGLVPHAPQHVWPWQSLLLLHMATVIFATHDLELDAWQVLGAAALHKYDVVLLQAVALSGDKADGLAACAEPHAAALPVGRVGLLGFAGERAQNHTLQLRPTLGGPGTGRRPLRRPPAVNLVQSGHGAGGPEPGRQG